MTAGFLSNFPILYKVPSDEDGTVVGGSIDCVEWAGGQSLHDVTEDPAFN